jgi:hypothetical protein
MTKNLKDLMEKASAWPEEAQEELVAYGRELEGALGGGYHATADELAGIDRGIAAANAGDFATDAEVEEVLAMFHHA